MIRGPGTVLRVRPPSDRLIAEADALTPGNPYDVHTLTTRHVGSLLRPAQVAGIPDQLTV